MPLAPLFMGNFSYSSPSKEKWGWGCSSMVERLSKYAQGPGFYPQQDEKKMTNQQQQQQQIVTTQTKSTAVSNFHSYLTFFV
jgi:hypothetical protein